MVGRTESVPSLDLGQIAFQSLQAALLVLQLGEGVLALALLAFNFGAKALGFIDDLCVLLIAGRVEPRDGSLVPSRVGGGCFQDAGIAAETLDAVHQPLVRPERRIAQRKQTYSVLKAKRTEAPRLPPDRPPGRGRL